MNAEEYEKLACRMNEYNRLKNRLEQIEESKEQVGKGIGSIITVGHKERIDIFMNDGFYERFQEAVVNFYDNEIELIKGQMDAV